MVVRVRLINHFLHIVTDVEVESEDPSEESSDEEINYYRRPRPLTSRQAVIANQKDASHISLGTNVYYLSHHVL